MPRYILLPQATYNLIVHVCHCFIYKLCKYKRIENYEVCVNLYFFRVFIPNPLRPKLVLLFAKLKNKNGEKKITRRKFIPNNF